MAYNEDVIRRNPFDFNLSDVIPNDTKSERPSQEDTREAWMEFIRTDEVYQKYYDEFVVLLGTGLRVSEFCGLTRNDLDFENRRIRWNTSFAASGMAPITSASPRRPAESGISP